MESRSHPVGKGGHDKFSGQSGSRRDSWDPYFSEKYGPGNIGSKSNFLTPKPDKNVHDDVQHNRWSTDRVTKAGANSDIWSRGSRPDTVMSNNCFPQESAGSSVVGTKSGNWPRDPNPSFGTKTSGQRYLEKWETLPDTPRLNNSLPQEPTGSSSGGMKSGNWPRDPNPSFGTKTSGQRYLEPWETLPDTPRLNDSLLQEPTGSSCGGMKSGNWPRDSKPSFDTKTSGQRYLEPWESLPDTPRLNNSLPQEPTGSSSGGMKSGNWPRDSSPLFGTKTSGQRYLEPWESLLDTPRLNNSLPQEPTGSSSGGMKSGNWPRDSSPLFGTKTSGQRYLEPWESRPNTPRLNNSLPQEPTGSSSGGMKSGNWPSNSTPSFVTKTSGQRYLDPWQCRPGTVRPTNILPLEPKGLSSGGMKRGNWPRDSNPSFGNKTGGQQDSSDPSQFRPNAVRPNNGLLLVSAGSSTTGMKSRHWPRDANPSFHTEIGGQQDSHRRELRPDTTRPNKCLPQELTGRSDVGMKSDDWPRDSNSVFGATTGLKRTTGFSPNCLPQESIGPRHIGAKKNQPIERDYGPDKVSTLSPPSKMSKRGTNERSWPLEDSTKITDNGTYDEKYGCRSRSAKAIAKPDPRFPSPTTPRKNRNWKELTRDQGERSPVLVEAYDKATPTSSTKTHARTIQSTDLQVSPKRKRIGSQSDNPVTSIRQKRSREFDGSEMSNVKNAKNISNGRTTDPSTFSDVRTSTNVSEPDDGATKISTDVDANDQATKTVTNLDEPDNEISSSLSEGHAIETSVIGKPDNGATESDAGVCVSDDRATETSANVRESGGQTSNISSGITESDDQASQTGGCVSRPDETARVIEPAYVAFNISTSAGELDNRATNVRTTVGVANDVAFETAEPDSVGNNISTTFGEPDNGVSASVSESDNEAIKTSTTVIDESNDRASKTCADISELDDRDTNISLGVSAPENQDTNTSKDVCELSDQATTTSTRISNSDDQALKTVSNVSEPDDRATKTSANARESGNQATNMSSGFTEPDNRASQLCVDRASVWISRPDDGATVSESHNQGINMRSNFNEPDIQVIKVEAEANVIEPEYGATNNGTMVAKSDDRAINVSATLCVSEDHLALETAELDDGGTKIYATVVEPNDGISASVRESDILAIKTSATVIDESDDRASKTCANISEPNDRCTNISLSVSAPETQATNTSSSVCDLNDQATATSTSISDDRVSKTGSNVDEPDDRAIKPSANVSESDDQATTSSTSVTDSEGLTSKTGGSISEPANTATNISAYFGEDEPEDPSTKTNAHFSEADDQVTTGENVTQSDDRDTKTRASAVASENKVLESSKCTGEPGNETSTISARVDVSEDQAANNAENSNAGTENIDDSRHLDNVETFASMSNVRDQPQDWLDEFDDIFGEVTSSRQIAHRGSLYNRTDKTITSHTDNGATVSSLQQAATSPQRTVASTQQAGPSHQQTVASLQQTVSSPQQTIVSPQQIVPSLQQTIVSPQQIVASLQQTVSSPQQTIVSPQQIVPSLQQTIVSPQQIVASLQQTIVSPQQIVASLQQTVSSPQQTIVSPQQIVPSLQQTIVSPQQIVASLQQTVASPQQTIASPQQTVASPQQTVASPQQTFANLHQPVASLQETVDSLQQTVVSLQQAAASLQQAVAILQHTAASPRLTVASPQQPLASPQQTVASPQQTNPNLERACSAQPSQIPPNSCCLSLLETFTGIRLPPGSTRQSLELILSLCNLITRSQ